MSKFERIKLKDIMAMLVAAVLLTPAVFFAEKNLLLAVFAVVFVASVLAILRRKVSMAVVSIVLAGCLSMILQAFVTGSTNTSIAGLMILAGILFEIIVFLARGRGIGLVFAGGISAALIPFMAYAVMGISVKENISMLALKGVDYLVVGIGGAVLALIVWFFIRNIRSVLMFVHSR